MGKINDFSTYNLGTSAKVAEILSREISEMASVKEAIRVSQSLTNAVQEILNATPRFVTPHYFDKNLLSAITSIQELYKAAMPNDIIQSAMAMNAGLTSVLKSNYMAYSTVSEHMRSSISEIANSVVGTNILSTASDVLNELELSFDEDEEDDGEVIQVIHNGQSDLLQPMTLARFLALLGIILSLFHFALAYESTRSQNEFNQQMLDNVQTLIEFQAEKLEILQEIVEQHYSD